MAQPSPQQRTKNRARDRQLSREEIVATALELAKRVGIENVTMRELADSLQVTPMAAYYWVKDKNELTRLVSEAFHSQFELPPASAGPWYERLRTLYLTMHAAGRKAPGLLTADIERFETEANQRLYNDQVELLVEAGFPAERAILGVEVLAGHLLGRAALSDSFRRQRWKRRAGRTVAAAGRKLREEDIFEYGLDLALDSLRRDLRTARRTKPAEPS